MDTNNLTVKSKLRCYNYFINGLCLFGDKYIYSHIYPPHFKTKLCRHYLKYGKCNQGDLCNFIHQNKIIEKKISNLQQSNPQQSKSIYEKKTQTKIKKNNDIEFNTIINRKVSSSSTNSLSSISSKNSLSSISSNTSSSKYLNNDNNCDDKLNNILKNFIITMTPNYNHDNIINI